MVLSANCQGLRDFKKRVDVIQYFKETGAHIICLQDTHLNEKDTLKFCNIWPGKFYLNGKTTNSRGVAVLFSKNFEFKVMSVNNDNDGNLLHLDIEIFDNKIKLVNLYAPNIDSPTFFRNIENLLLQSQTSYDFTIICGDFNLVLDPVKDTYNYKQINNPNPRHAVLDIIESCQLTDIFRIFNQTEKRFTWR